MVDGVLFDLDGTLWDAVPQIARSWNLALAQLGISRAPLTPRELYPCMGMLLPDIGRRLLPGVPPDRQGEVMDHCCRVECDYLSRHGAALYPGAEETLTALAGKYSLFVVSNCQDGYIQAFFLGTGLGKFFTDFESAGHTGLPKSQNISLMVGRHRLEHPVYVGDTALDRDSAQAAGVPFVHAGYGFGQVEGVPAIQSLDQLAPLLETM